MPIRCSVLRRWPALAAALSVVFLAGIFSALPLRVAIAQEAAPGAESSTASTQAPASVDPVAEPEPLSEEAQELIKQFEEKQQTWAETLAEMRAIQIRYSNGADRSRQSLQRFHELRDRSRGEMRELFDVGVQLFELRDDYFEAASVLATALDYRRENSIYEDSFQAAKLLIEAGATMPYLYLMAARAAFVEGHFDEVMPLYETFVEVEGPDKLEKVDQQIVNILDFYPQWWEEELQRRAEDAQAGDLPRVLLETTRGPVLLELFEDQAPNTVANFIRLVEEGYYDETEFYQVIDDLMAMGGDPRGDGSGTSGRFIPDEHDHPQRRRIFRGSLFMAKMSLPGEDAGFAPDSASSQFIIALMPIIPKDPSQTVFGRVIQGMDVVGSFQRIDPQEKKEEQIQLPPDRILTARVVRKRDHDYSVTYVPGP